MKKLMCLLLTLSLTLVFLTASYAQDAPLDTLHASDVNDDGVINILDLTLVAASFGKIPTADQTLNPDVNGDGNVNILDLTLVAAHLGKTVRPPVSFVSVDPAIDSQLEINGTITLTFDNAPGDVSVNTGTATVTDQTVAITGPFDLGALALTVTWADGSETITYTVRPPVSFVSVDPTIDSQLEADDTITLTFDNAPEDVSVNTGVATVTDQTVAITGPFDPGALALTVTWKDGTQTLAYTVRQPAAFVSSKPATNTQINVDGTITLTFDNPPEDVEVSPGVATIDGKTVAITGPFDPGDLELTVTWKDGAQTLTYTIRPPANFVSATPPGGKIAANDTITLAFDHRPRNVTVNTGTARTIAKTVRITGPFDPGPLALTITWNDGTQTLNYTVAAPDSDAPEITDATVSDGDKNVNSESINSDARIQLTFNEAVSGNIELQTEAGVDVGWLGKVDGDKGTLELVRDKELGYEVTYVITGKVSDAAGNATDIDITFTTASRSSGIPFAVTDATFNSLVLESTIPVVVEFWKDN